MSTTDHPPTPKLSFHAQLRCREMEVSTKRVKRIVRAPDVTYQTSDQTSLSRRDDDPGIAVVWANSPTGPFVVTVVWATQDDYVRDGNSFTVVQPS